MQKDMADMKTRLINDSRNHERWIIGTVIATVVAGVAVLGSLQKQKRTIADCLCLSARDSTACAGHRASGR